MSISYILSLVERSLLSVNPLVHLSYLFGMVYLQAALSFYIVVVLVFTYHIYPKYLDTFNSLPYLP